MNSKGSVIHLGATPDQQQNKTKRVQKKCHPSRHKLLPVAAQDETASKEVSSISAQIPTSSGTKLIEFKRSVTQTKEKGNKQRGSERSSANTKRQQTSDSSLSWSLSSRQNGGGNNNRSTELKSGKKKPCNLGIASKVKHFAIKKDRATLFESMLPHSFIYVDCLSHIVPT